MMQQKAMQVVGVMSGTSADGIDVAVVRIYPQKKSPRLSLLAHESYAFPANLRAAILAAMDAKDDCVADLSRLGTRLGIAYAEAVRSTFQKHGLQAELIGCHGQTVYHQSKVQQYLGRKVATTWQLLDTGPITEMLRLPVVSDFRPADVAAGGQGAPLVPLFDYEFFRSARQHRILLNLGGIGNMSLLPAGCSTESVLAFDTGPGNMVIDALMRKLFGKAFDRDGAVAALGRPVRRVIDSALRKSFFLSSPPKSAGREQFGEAFTQRLLVDCRKHSQKDADAVATATQLTAEAVALAIRAFARPAMPKGIIELIVSGGGTRNATLMRCIGELTSAQDCRLRTTDELGMPSEAKEAAAFALLAWNTWHGLPGNLPSATGAKRQVILGRISHA